MPTDFTGPIDGDLVNDAAAGGAGTPLPPATIVVNGIEAEVDPDEFAKGESLLQGPPWREVVYWVPWGKSDNFMDSLLGLIRTNPDGDGSAGSGVRREPPHRFPGNALLYCTSVEARGVGVSRPDAKLVASDWAKVRARYEVPIFDVAGGSDGPGSLMVPPGVEPQPYSSWDFDGGTRLHQLPQDATPTADGGTPSRPFQQRTLLETISVTYYAVPYVWLELYRGLCKRVNKDPMFGWPKECVLYDSYKFNKVINWDGSYAQNLTLTFLCQPMSWNSVPLEDDIGFVGVQGAKDSTKRPYPLDDLTPLITRV